MPDPSTNVATSTGPTDDDAADLDLPFAVPYGPPRWLRWWRLNLWAVPVLFVWPLLTLQHSPSLLLYGRSFAGLPFLLVHLLGPPLLGVVILWRARRVAWAVTVTSHTLHLPPWQAPSPPGTYSLHFIPWPYRTTPAYPLTGDMRPRLSAEGHDHAIVLTLRDGTKRWIYRAWCRSDADFHALFDHLAAVIAVHTAEDAATVAELAAITPQTFQTNYG